MANSKKTPTSIATDKAIFDSLTKITPKFKNASEKIVNEMYELYLELKANGEPTLFDLMSNPKWAVIEKHIAEETGIIGKSQSTILNKNLPALFITVQKLADKEVEKAIVVAGKSSAAATAVSFKVVNKKALEKLSSKAMMQKAKDAANKVWCNDGYSWSYRIWRSQNALAANLKQGMMDAINNGTSPDKLKRQLMKDFNVAYYQADRLVRTEMAHIETEGTIERYKDWGLTKGVWIVEKDDDLCEECESHADEVMDLEEINSMIPLHPNCRCSVGPYFEDLAENEK